MRILYVHATVLPPPTDPRTDRFFLLSEMIEGDVLQPVWFQTPEEVEAVFGPGSYPVHTVGKFRYHWMLGSPHRDIRQRLATFVFYLRKGLELHRQRRFDCIVAYSHMTTGFIAAILKILTSGKLIIEIATSPDSAYITERPHPHMRERAMKLYSDISLHLTMFIADRAHLLYHTQLVAYRLLHNKPHSVFHEYVPVSRLDRHDHPAGCERYVLMVGAPWYPKGADVLIKAFLELANEFPDVKLKLLGFYPDQTALNALIGGSPQVEILKPRPHPEALKVIARASVIVLPSRYEGLGRALIEGMAAGIPVVGSDVGGIPMLIRDGENGFLIPVGDSNLLRERLRLLLQDPQLSRRMGDAGYTRAHSELDERTYVREFSRMVEATVRGDNAGGH